MKARPISFSVLGGNCYGNATNPVLYFNCWAFVDNDGFILCYGCFVNQRLLLELKFYKIVDHWVIDIKRIG